MSLAIDLLHMLEQARGLLQHRRPLGGPGSEVALVLSYNGTAWLNAAIGSTCLVGNRLVVKYLVPQLPVVLWESLRTSVT